MEDKPEPPGAGQNSGASAELAYRAILDSALDCIITMDATGRVREFNHAAERVFARKAKTRAKAPLLSLTCR
jgi:PAS domain-containing protein